MRSIRECGELSLFGLPISLQDKVRLNLPTYFVPLRLEPQENRELLRILNPDLLNSYQTVDSGSGVAINLATTQKRKSRRFRPRSINLGIAIEKISNLAILAPLGGGKSTIIKRLALNYAAPEIISIVDDPLPVKDWFPVVLKCRQLKRTIRESFNQILGNIPKYAEMPEQSLGFRLFLSQIIATGQILLLIDGIDEIQSEKDRTYFIEQLNSFLNVNPQVHTILTTRDIGFRSLSQYLDEKFGILKISEFQDSQIRRLVETWYSDRYNMDLETIHRRDQLIISIISTDTLRQLAGNPLLLTIILVVEGSTGLLITKRTTLYDETIKVLLRSWNLGAHEPIDPDEAIPQLAFVAYMMFDAGIYQISHDRLVECLNFARSEMPGICDYISITIYDFIKQVVERSNILVLASHPEEQGSLQRVYEFQHTSFQEYLAAIAIVKHYLPAVKDTGDLASIFSDKLREHSWKEVILLTALLSGQGVLPLFNFILEKCNRSTSPEDTSIFGNLLAEFLKDGVQVPSQNINSALEFLIPNFPSGIIEIAKSNRPYKLWEKCLEIFKNDQTYNWGILRSCSAVNLIQRGWYPLELEDYDISNFSLVIHGLQNDLHTGKDAFTAICIDSLALIIWEIDFVRDVELSQEEKQLLIDASNNIAEFISAQKKKTFYAALNALPEICGLLVAEKTKEVINSLIMMFSGIPEDKIQIQLILKALSTLPLQERDFFDFSLIAPNLYAFIKDNVSDCRSIFPYLILNYYIRGPYTDEEVKQIFIQYSDTIEDPIAFFDENILGLAQNLGGKKFANEIELKVNENASQSSPKSIHRWIEIGLLRERLGDLVGAGDAYENALNLKPTSVQAWRRFGWNQERQGNNDKAAQANEKASKLDDQAKKAFEQIIELNFSNIRHWETQLIALKHKGNLNEAIEAGQKFIDACEECRIKFDFNFHELLEIFDYEQILGLMENIISDANYNLACLYALSGDEVQCIKFLRPSIMNNPEWLEAAYSSQDFASMRDTPAFQSLMEELPYRLKT